MALLAGCAAGHGGPSPARGEQRRAVPIHRGDPAQATCAGMNKRKSNRSKPVAKLVRVLAGTTKRPGWNREAHARWQERVGGRKLPSSDEALAESRSERD